MAWQASLEAEVPSLAQASEAALQASQEVEVPSLALQVLPESLLDETEVALLVHEGHDPVAAFHEVAVVPKQASVQEDARASEEDDGQTLEK